MHKLIIEQQKFNEVEFEFKSIVEAAIMVEQLRPYAPANTKFTIKQEEEITKEGGNEDGEPGI